MTTLQAKLEETAKTFIASTQEWMGAEGWAETISELRNTDESRWGDHFGNRVANEIYFATDEWVAAGADLGVVDSDDEAEEEASNEKIQALIELLKIELVKVIKAQL